MAGRGNLNEVEPINPDRAIVGQFASGVSLSASFADAYAKYSGRSVGMIPCADGGTVIAQWQKGAILYDRSEQYFNAVANTSTYTIHKKCANSLILFIV